MTTQHTDPTEALAQRLFESLTGGMELLSVELGRRLGLYETLRAHGAATSAALAERSGIDVRYAREWLEQQAAAGFLDVDTETGDAATRSFALPAAHAPVLLDAEHPAHMMATAPFLTGAALTLPAVAAAYRNGGGVPYAEFGAEIRDGIAAFNRPMFVGELTAWLATMPDVVERLRAGGRVLDVACGVGWSSIATARAFEKASVHGVDMDEASIAEARQNALQAGVAERVTFEVRDISDLQATAGYDLACVFEALHDMGEPIEALRTIRPLLAAGAPLLVADERVADEFTAPAEEVERLQYAFSVLHCLPATMAESTAVANGTVLRAPTVRAWAEAAGYPGMQVLPIEHDFWRFYRLDA